MQSALDFQSTFQGMLCSSTTKYLPHTVLEIRRAESTIYASQLEAYFQENQSEQVPENRYIVEQSACQVADASSPTQAPMLT
jgi:hypothetical protein